MSNQNKKIHDPEFQHAALMAICSLLVFVLTAVAGGALLMLFRQFGDLVESLSSKVPY